MKKIQLSVLAVVAAGVALQLAAAPTSPNAVRIEPIIETTAENLILPSSAAGLLVVSECKGCPLKSFRTMAATGYRLNEKPVTLAEFRAALIGRPKTNINVVRSVKTGELLYLDAASDSGFAPRPVPKRKK